MTTRHSLRILHVITPHRFGGAEHVLAHLAAAQVRRGHTVRVAMPPRLPEFQEYMRALDVEVVTANVAGKLNFAAPARIAALAAGMNADVIHSHLSSASLNAARAARRAGVPVVAHIQALSSPRWYARADAVIVCSKAVERHVRELGLGGIPIHVIYDGIPLADAARLKPPEEMRRELGIPSDAPVVGAVAALIPRKGHVHLLEAAARLADRWPHLHLVFVGSGPEEPRLEELARQLGIQDRLRLLGWRDDKLDIVRTFTLVAIPSLSVDGFSMTALEAAQFGIPAVASDLPGVDEAVLHEKTGLLVPPAEPDRLAEAIARLLGDSELRRRLGEQARERVVSELTIDHTAEQIDTVYRQAIEAARRALTA